MNLREDRTPQQRNVVNLVGL